MFAVAKSALSLAKPELYRETELQLAALFAGETDRIANAANMAALLYDVLPELNWAGFYFLKAGELVLGPFQGKPACVRIAVGRGVCGTAVAERKTMLVTDVHAFPGHIACDAASRSEIVVPLSAMASSKACSISTAPSLPASIRKTRPASSGWSRSISAQQEASEPPAATSNPMGSP